MIDNFVIAAIIFIIIVVVIISKYYYILFLVQFGYHLQFPKHVVTSCIFSSLWMGC